MRRLRYPLYALAATTLFAAAGAAWLLYTASGAAWLWARTEAVLDGRLSAGAVSGSLRRGFAIDGLRYADGSVEIESERFEFAVDPDLLLPRLTIIGPRAASLSIVVRRRDDAGIDADAAPGGGPGPILESLVPPLPLAVRDLDLQRLYVGSADGRTYFAADRIRSSATLDDALSIEGLSVSALGATLGLDGRLELSAPFAVQANADLQTPGRAAAGLLPGEARLELSGSITRLELDATTRAPDARIEGRIGRPFELADVELELTSDSLPLQDGSDRTVVDLEDLRLAVSGALDDYRARASARVVTPWAAPLAAETTVSGNLDGLDTVVLEIESPDLGAGATGELYWIDGLSAAADIDVARLDPARWSAGWPAGETLRGRVSAALASRRVDLRSLHVEHREAAVDGRGVVDLDERLVDLELSWTDLQWPLRPAPARVSSREASVAVRGAPDDWTLEGNIALSAPELPEGQFTLAGGGDPEGVEFRIDDSRVLGGRVTGEVTFRYDEGGQWTALLDTAGVRLEPLLPDWPGNLGARIDANGRVAPLALDVHIAELTGQLRARPVAAEGGFAWRDGSLSFDDLRIRSGTTSLALAGNWGDGRGVTFEFASDTLSDLLPDAVGEVEASGRLLAADPWPLLELDLSAAEVGWRDWSVERLEIGNRPTSPDAPLALELELGDLQAADRRIESLDLALAGGPSAHRLTVEAANADGTAAIALSGGLDDARRPAAGWAGEIAALRLAANDGLSLTLREPAALDLSADELRLASSCLETGDGGSLCLGGRWGGDGYRADIGLASLPLDLLRAVTGTELEFTQRLSGEIEMAAGPSGRPSGSGRIDVTAGLIRNSYDERLTLSTRPGFAAFELESGQLLAAEISLPFSDAAEIAGSFRVADVAQGGNSPVSGQLRVNVRDVGVGARIVPQIDEAGGRLDADIRVDGTLAAPRFAGGFSLADGRIAYDPLGVSIADIQLEGTIREGNRVELESSFVAGEGRGRIRSSADYLQGRSGGFEVAMTGENLQFINLDDLSVTIDPDLSVGLRGDDIRINGRVAVPAARLASVKFVNTGVSESDDVVFTGGERPPGDEPQAETQPLDWRGSVELVLGDNVVVDLDVAEARLGGRATYTWEGPALPQASGAFNVSGKFEAYGQLLEISEGTVRYPNVPANNPELRIRAEREIFGNSQVRRAGVLVTGTALRPKIEVYTTPATTQNRALTLLATGSDFNYEQGVGALDVGTYIAPDLYISYGIGLFDRGNVISLRYDLARGFGVKATSGKNAAGVDLSYTIER